MICTFAQDEIGDLAIDTKGPRLVFGAEAVVVLVQNNLRERPGENFLLPLRGRAWSSFIGKGANATAIRTLICSTLGDVSGVTQIKSCTVSIMRDKIEVDLVIATNQARTELPITMTL